MAVKVAIAGVGNCANSLVQGVAFYADAAEGASIPGLMHNRFGTYAVGDVEFVAAFDVDALKVGADLADAIWASQNSTYRFADVAATGVTVQRGPTLDGLGEYYREVVDESDAPAVDVADGPRRSDVDALRALCAACWSTAAPTSPHPRAGDAESAAALDRLGIGLSAGTRPAG